MIIKLRYYLTFILPFIVSSLIIYLSLDVEKWKVFWTFFNIPLQIPPFSDLDSISRALNAKLEGFDPYVYNPYDLSQKPYSYTKIWITIFEFFEFNDPNKFRILNFILIYFYTLIFFDLAFRSNSSIFSFLLFLCFFSTSNLLLLERLNIEISIVILVYLICIIKSDYLRIPIFFSAISLKLYPIFSIFVFIQKKINFLIIVTLSLFFLFLIRNEIILIMENSVDYALIITHGITSIIKGISYYSIRHNLFINENNYIYFKIFFIFLMSIYFVALFFFNFRFEKKELPKQLNLEEKLFLCGGGIFIGRILFFSNWDYGLVFLIFTLPFILKANIKFGFVYIFLALVCMNSLYLESGDKYTLIYATKAFFIHSIKILLFSYISVIFSQIINKHVEIKFN
tara:strand:- start:430 stop:1623 length:1194 start_codon:yes stop_codon:yes gene_type:complete